VPLVGQLADAVQLVVHRLVQQRLFLLQEVDDALVDALFVALAAGSSQLSQLWRSMSFGCQISVLEAVVGMVVSR
jgi:hypothetical protein